MVLLTATDGDEQRDPQLVNVQRIREWGVLIPKWNIYTTLYPLKLKDHTVKSGRKTVKARSDRWIQYKYVFWIVQGSCIYEPIAQDPWKLKSNRYCMDGGDGWDILALAEDILAIDRCQERESHFSLLLWLLVHWTHSKGQSIQEYLRNKLDWTRPKKKTNNNRGHEEGGRYPNTIQTWNSWINNIF